MNSSETHPLHALFENAVEVASFRPSQADAELVNNLLCFRFKDVQIVHFMLHDYFHSLVANRALLAKRLDLYEDFEGVYPEANLHSDSSIDQQVGAQLPIVKDKRAMIASQGVSRTLSYIHCWFEGSPYDLTMWDSEYGRGGKAVCLVSRTLALQKAMAPPPKQFHYDFGRCTYRDETEPIPEGISSAPAYRKRRKYSWEQEVRMLVRFHQGHEPKDGDGHIVLPPQTTPLALDLSTLIHQIVTGPALSPSEVGEIVNAASSFLCPTQIRPLRY